MIKKTIKYTDYFGEDRKEDFYFNLTKTELIEFDADYDGGMQYALIRIAQTKDVRRMVMFIKDLIRRSYGEKSPDGKRFVKSRELSDAFMQTDAYDRLFIELLNNENAVNEFLRGIVPTEVAEEMDKQLKAVGGDTEKLIELNSK